MCADRDEMQDSVFCIPHFAAPEHYLIAAVDGHSSYYVSYYFSQVFPKIFYDILQNKELVLTIEDAFREAFATIQQAILDTPNVSDGAVVTVIFLTPQTIYTAQCGDCRAIYLTEDEVIQLAPEHKTVDPIERKRIRSDGGYVDTANRVGGLLVARSVGDIKHKPIISEHPEVTKTERRSNERFLVVATDGLWDEVSNEMVFNILNQNKTVFRTSQLAALLRDTAYISCIANQHPDNIGIVLCRF
ncbi:protein-serine/threonine phosphatase [Entamoeba marina]